MSIMTKWRAAAAGVLTLALVAGGAAAANAAPQNPQPNGSAPIFVWDENGASAESADGTRAYGRNEFLFLSNSATDNGAAIPATTGATQAFRFIAKTDKVDNGTNTWSAWTETAIINGAVAYDQFTLGDLGQGDLGKVFSDGGTYYAGLAFTINNGVTVIGKVYRTVTIAPGASTYTLNAIAQEAAFTPDFANYAATSGAAAVLRNGNLELDATAANAGKTVDVWVEGESTAKHTSVVLNGSGKATVTSNIAAGKKLAIVEGNAVVAWVTTADFVIAQPTDGTALTTKVTIPAPAEGATTVTVPAGVTHANQTYTAYGWSNPTNLGQVTTDGSGNAVVNVSALGVGTHTVALVDGAGDYVAWGTVELTSTTSSATEVSVDVTTSNKFALEGVAASIDLGDVKRGATTTASLPSFRVTDDRALLPGWTLNAAASKFVNASAGNDEIAASALSIVPSIVSGESTGITVPSTAIAGTGVFAEGGVNASTLEAGTNFNAALTFVAPAAAKAGTYTSTLTLTLVSK